LRHSSCDSISCRPHSPEKHTTMPPQKKSCRSRCFGCVIILGFLGGAGYGAWHLLGRPDLDEFFDFDNFGNVLGNLTDFGGNWGINDPFDGQLSSNETSQWDIGGNKNGLNLELLNALDEAWQEEFVLAVSDWENGSPDALTLTTRQVAFDSKCTPVDGRMKVCNGNYGDTGWLGINEIVAYERNNIIIHSVAKMNEYYLLNANQDERQYTMCHEIGHGFGLPHTDENFYNRDLGNCMDYTKKPQNNLHPDDTNYARLASLYGQARRYLTTGRSWSLQSITNVRIPSETPPIVLSNYERAISNLEREMLIQSRDGARRALSVSGWRLLEAHPRGNKYATYLGEGYTLEVHMLSSRNE